MPRLFFWRRHQETDDDNDYIIEKRRESERERHRLDRIEREVRALEAEVDSLMEQRRLRDERES